MKNKILASLTALCAALVLVGGFSVTAYAQTPTEETDDSGVIVETEPQPLTPEGNMTLPIYRVGKEGKCNQNSKLFPLLVQMERFILAING